MYMHVCIYIYVYIYIHTYIHKYIHTYIHTIYIKPSTLNPIMFYESSLLFAFDAGLAGTNRKI
jgi:hypothetical protein